MKLILKHLQEWGQPLAFIAFLATFFACNKTPEKQQEGNEQQSQQQLSRRQKRHEHSMHLDSLLYNRKLKEGLLCLDSLHRLYPQDPQFYFIEGWVYDMMNDTTKAHMAFIKAHALYDSLIIKNEDVGDKVNHAFITQILYGKEAFDTELKEFAHSAANSQDSLYIEGWHDFLYKKELLFRLYSSDSSGTKIVL